MLEGTSRTKALIFCQYNHDEIHMEVAVRENQMIELLTGPRIVNKHVEEMERVRTDRDKVGH